MVGDLDIGLAADVDQAEQMIATFLADVSVASTMYRDELLAACLELLLQGMGHHRILLPTQASI